MTARRLALLCLTLAVFCSFARAQTQPSDPKPAASETPTDADKEKKQKEIQQRVQQMLDQSVNDANGLRLPQNKAIVFAMAGDMYWRFDEKHARDLFRSAANEVVSYNGEVEREQADAANNNNNNGFVPPDPSSDIRSQILSIVAGRDPELAYQMLLQTRSPKLADAMARAGQSQGQNQTQNNRGGGPQGRGGPNAGGGRGDQITPQQVNDELGLEQQFAALAAANDPDAAIKLIKDSMSKGVTNQVLPLLQNLYKKDDKKATDLAGDVISNLVGADMAAGQQQFNTALSFLNFATRPPAATDPSAGSSAPPEKQFAFTDAQIRDLANKIVNTLSSATPSPQLANQINRALPTIQKVAPDRALLLSQKLAESQKTMPNAGRAAQQQVRQFDRNATPEDILAQVPKMTTENEKRIAYQSIASKAAQIKDDDSRAQKLIDQIGDEGIRATAQQQFDSAKANRAASAGKLDDARKMIASITDRRTRIQRLVQLAQTFQKNGTEKDLDAARSIMKDARGLIKEVPDDEDDIADLMEVVRGYATVDPDIAFRLAEPMFDVFNDTINAAAVLSKYNKRDRTFKKGELIMKLNGGGGGFGGFGGGGNNSVMLFRYVGQIQQLGKADLDRMSAIADRLSRGDARTITRLFVLQGYLAKDRRAAGPAPQPAQPGN